MAKIGARTARRLQKAEPHAGSGKIHQEGSLSVMKSGPLPAVFSYTPFSTFLNCVKPCFPILSVDKEVDWLARFGRDIFLRTGL